MRNGGVFAGIVASYTGAIPSPDSHIEVALFTKRGKRALCMVAAVDAGLLEGFLIVKRTPLTHSADLTSHLVLCNTPFNKI